MKKKGIPVPTANRYVKRHEDALARAEGKLLIEQLRVPTAEEVKKRVKQWAPKLTSFLTTRPHGSYLENGRRAGSQTGFQSVQPSASIRDERP